MSATAAAAERGMVMEDTKSKVLDLDSAYRYP